MKITAIIAVFTLVVLPLMAQKDLTSLQVFQLPQSTHSAALGGASISLIADDPTLATLNPALLSSVTDRTLSFGYLSYIAGSKVLNATYTQALGERHTMGFSAGLVNYGTLDETNEAGMVIGRFSAKEMLFGLRYSYVLSDRWVGGAALKMAYANYANYTALALAVDVGLNYYDDYTGTSLSFLLQNIGAPLKSMDEQQMRIPFELQMGLTQRIQNAPLRFSLTLIDLTHWGNQYYYTVDPTASNGFLKKLLGHIVLGADILASERLYLSVGYNVRRARELKAAGAAHGAGLSCGAGLQLERFKLGLSYAKYHVAASSIGINLAYSF